MKKKIQWMDTLRCFAFALILIYHFYPNNFRGGFLGVDLLFVLSGYLVTARALDAVAREGQFKKNEFYRKRILRILPAVVLMVAVSSLLVLFANKDLRVDIGRQTAGVLGFVTNWYEILSGGSYETKFVPHIYVHNWSLAIEMHYYLIWGWILFILSGRAKNRAQSRKARFQKEDLSSFKTATALRSRLMAISLFGIAFFTLFQWFGLGKEYSTSFLYFSDLTRGAPFFFGSLAASLSGLDFVPRSFLEKTERRGAFYDLLVFLGAGALLVFFSFFFSYEDSKTYFFGFLLTDLVSMVMILTARSLHEKSREGIEPALVHGLSKYSYGLYLFHYPIYIIAKTKLPHLVSVALALVFGLLLAILAEEVWAPLWTGQEMASPRENKRKKKLLLRALGGIGVFVLMVGLTAPSMLSLEKVLWAESLHQDMDQVESSFKTVQNLAVKEKDKEERKVAEAKLENQGVTVIGDSVALGMRPYFLEAFPNINVDGSVSRFLHHGDAVLLQMARQKVLKKNVVICLGNNVYPSYERDAKRIAEALPKGCRLIFVAPYDKRVDQSSDVEKYAKFLPSLEKHYPYVTIANWNAVAKGHPEYFTDTDGVHFYARKEGISPYMNCVKDALAKATKKPVKE